MNVLEMLKRLSMLRAIALGVILAILYYFLMYDSGATQTQNLASANTNIQQLQNDIKENQKKLDRALIYKKTAAEIGTTINRLLGVIPEKFGISDLTKIVSNEARIAGTSLNGITSEPPEISPVAKEFEEFLVHLDVSGTFGQHMVFLSNLTKINQILILRKFDLQAQRDNPNSELVQVHMMADIVAYRYRGNLTPAKPAPAPGGAPAPPPANDKGG